MHQSVVRLTTQAAVVEPQRLQVARVARLMAQQVVLILVAQVELSLSLVVRVEQQTLAVAT